MSYLCYKRMIMGVIATNKNEIILYYSSESTIGKQTLAYVSASEKKILAIDISKTKVTGTQWAEIASGLNVSISELINTEHPDFIKVYSNEKVDLEEHDWLRILDKHPETLVCPIIIIEDEFHMIKSPSDFVKYMESDTISEENPD